MAFEPFSWTCLHCGHPQTVTEPHFDNNIRYISVREHEWNTAFFQWVCIGCANSECRKLTLRVTVYGSKRGVSGHSEPDDDNILLHKRLAPESSVKPQPEYIPSALREDYLEACRIRDLSPKASATLIRRCLQGMIRNFCGISKNRLVDEIAELRERVAAGTAPPGVSAESVEAIDNVRQVGNIGAHMEKDIDIIVPVDPGEAQLLIELVENLFEEWYVARHKRQERFQAIKAIADAKQNAKSAPPATSTSPGGDGNG